MVLEHYNNNCDFQGNVLKMLIVTYSLILQKPSKNRSKLKIIALKWKNK